MKTITCRVGAMVFLAACVARSPAGAASVVPPVLYIQHINPLTVALLWTNTAPGFVLESVDSLDGSQPWIGVLQAPQLANARLVVTQSIGTITGRARFFRLAPKGSPAGTDYLLATQNPDGSWGTPNGSLLRDTAAVLESLAESGQTGTALFATGLSALASIVPRNNDDASRQVIMLALADWDVSASAANLLNSQNLEISDLLNTSYPGRAWGLASGFGNSTLDTALVLRALKAAGETAGLSVAAETLLGKTTSAARSLNLPAGSSDLVLKVRNLTGIVRFNIAYPNGSNNYVDLYTGQTPTSVSFPKTTGPVTFTVQNLSGTLANYSAELGFTGSDGLDTFSITTPLTFLGLAQNADGGWGITPGRDSQLMVTAEVVRSLAAWGQAFGPQQVLQSARTWLLSHQHLDGGFSSLKGSNLPETALAVLAILAIDPTTPLSSTASYLQSAQLPDGSWGSNPWQTALVMQAMRMPPVVSAISGQSVGAR